MSSVQVSKDGLHLDNLAIDITAIERIINQDKYVIDKRFLVYHVNKLVNGDLILGGENLTDSKPRILMSCDNFSINGEKIDDHHLGDLMKRSEIFTRKIQNAINPVLISYLFTDICASHTLGIIEDRSEIENKVKEILTDWVNNCELYVDISLDVLTLSHTDLDPYINKLIIHSIKKKCLRCGKVFTYTSDIFNGKGFIKYHID